MGLFHKEGELIKGDSEVQSINYGKVKLGEIDSRHIDQTDNKSLGGDHFSHSTAKLLYLCKMSVSTSSLLLFPSHFHLIS